MQQYIDQLIEIMHEAKNNRPSPRYMELPEEMECLRDVIELEKSLEEDEHTMESVFGIAQYYFPPENKLSDQQVNQLKNEILKLWRTFNYEAVFRKGEFNERQQYSMLVTNWKNHVPILRGTNGTWYIEMYDDQLYWDDDQMRYLSDEEYDAKFHKHD
jgi:hypothetical protein